MFRISGAFVAFVLMVSSQFSWAAVPDFYFAQNAFQRLPEDDRFGLPLMLAAAGYYNGMSTGEFNRRIFNGVVQFQSSLGAEPTGALSDEQRKLLFQAGGQFIGLVGLKEVRHPATGSRLYVPTRLLDAPTRTIRGWSFEGPDTAVDFSYYLASENTLADLYLRLAATSRTRQVTYKVLRDKFFVVAGKSADKNFYARYAAVDQGAVGFTLSWSEQAASGHGDRIAVLMSNLFLPKAASGEFPQTQTASPPMVPTPQAPPKSTPEAKKGGSSGSAFLVSMQGHLLTNVHVVSDCNSINVVGLGSAIVVAEDKTNDVALLKTSASLSGRPLRSSSKNLRLGDDIIVVGFPLQGILGGINVTTGNVSALSGLANDSTQIQFTAAIQPGNSGGPLLDRSGGLVGIVTSKLNDTTMIKAGGFVPQNVNFAIRKEMITAFLSGQGISLQTDQSATDRSVADVAEAARGAVFAIECK